MPSEMPRRPTDRELADCQLRVAQVHAVPLMSEILEHSTTVAAATCLSHDKKFYCFSEHYA